MNFQAIKAAAQNKPPTEQWNPKLDAIFTITEIKATTQQGNRTMQKTTCADATGVRHTVNFDIGRSGAIPITELNKPQMVKVNWYTGNGPEGPYESYGGWWNGPSAQPGQTPQYAAPQPQQQPQAAQPAPQSHQAYQATTDPVQACIVRQSTLKGACEVIAAVISTGIKLGGTTEAAILDLAIPLNEWALTGKIPPLGLPPSAEPQWNPEGDQDDPSIPF